MSRSDQSIAPMLTDEPSYNELIRSIPEAERSRVLSALDTDIILARAKQLEEELPSSKIVGVDLTESRILLLAALKTVKEKKISTAQLASLHILDSAILTLYIGPVIFLINKYADSKNNVRIRCDVCPITNTDGIPTRVRRNSYEHTLLPKEGMSITDLPLKMQKPLVQRFFNLSASEWTKFCEEMSNAPKSEQLYCILNAPEEGCWSNITFKIQKVLKCMRVLDLMSDSNDGLFSEKIMVVPSFSMFQAAINAKAHTLKRKPVVLVPTYGNIEAATLRASGKIALALYLPERYQYGEGNFRTTIDGHPYETAFGGAIYAVYHAMREMAMSENVAKARMRLASIAQDHPKNKMRPEIKGVDHILIDGELIYSYPPEIDTMFDPDQRSRQAQSFGEIFYLPHMRVALHDDLKRHFIEDMVLNKTLWQEQFNLGKSDLLEVDQVIYDKIVKDEPQIRLRAKAREEAKNKFNEQKSQIQKQFSTKLAELCNALDNITPMDSQDLYRALNAIQTKFFEKITFKSSKETVMSELLSFRQSCRNHVARADEILGHGALYRIVEMLINVVVRLFATIGMIIGMVGGQGFFSEEHRKGYKDTFFSFDKNESSELLTEFKEAVLGDDGEEQGLLDFKNICYVAG